MSCWLLINNIILLAVLLSGKVGPGQAIDWPAAAPATVCWHNYAAWCGSFNYIHAGLCAYVCACPGSETRMLKSKMWRQRFLAYFYICESNTALTVFSEKKAYEVIQQFFWLSLCVFFSNTFVNWILGILVGVICIPRMRHALSASKEWLLGIFLLNHHF